METKFYKFQVGTSASLAPTGVFGTVALVDR